MQTITIEKTKAPKAKPAKGAALGFGKTFTDHMFLMNYSEGKGWHSPRVVPYGPISLEPSAMCFHYGQEVFEGLKAYIAADGSVRMFRPQENFRRLNESNKRLAIPQLDETLLLEGLTQLISIERDWIPTGDGESLYIRPFVIATEEALGVKPSAEYLYMVILSPSGRYYESGLAPVKIYVEHEYVRAVKGGTGASKTGGNYASSLVAQMEAHDQGYAQVLWLDGIQRKYVDEVGAMNIFFVLEGEVVTPALSGSILPGITRKSVLELLRSWGMNVSERLISIDELEEAYKQGRFLEAFGTGTAAVISPVGTLRHGDFVMELSNGKIGEISQKLYDTLTGIQLGKLPDTFGWTVTVE